LAVRIFNHYVPIRVLLLAVVEFMLLICAALVGSLLRFGGDDAILLQDYPNIGLKAMAFGVVTLLALFAMGLYHGRISLTLQGYVARVFAALGMAAVVLAALYYFIEPVRLGRGMLAPSLVVAMVFLTGSRLVFTHLVGEDFFRRRVVVIGTGERATHLLELKGGGDSAGFYIVAFVEAAGSANLIGSRHTVTAPPRLLDFLKAHQVDEIVVAVDDRRSNLPLHELLECRMYGFPVVDVVSFMERETGKVSVSMLYPSWFIFSDHFGRGYLRRAERRIFDIVASLTLLLVFVPVIALAALAIWVESGLRGPVLFRQVRVGRNGRPFTLVKFRTMVPDAEKEAGAQWCDEEDPRITRVGSVLRKFRIDEAPQIFNVLKGQMSFVGPRPERPEFVATLSRTIPYYSERHVVKPGITGWAQLRYPYGATEQDALEKLQYDLYYAKNQSLLFDIAVLLQTVEVVLWRKGAR
jgi:sugar transferase (PEP-CTERM system associated)